MSNPFVNPYTFDPASDIYIGKAGLWKDRLDEKGNNPNLANVQFTVHRDHKHFLKRIRPEVGTEAICMSILYKKLIDALKEGMIDTPEGLETFVSQCKLVMR